MSKCVYLASMAVKLEHTVAGRNHDILQQCIFDVHASRTTGPRESSRNKHKCPLFPDPSVQLMQHCACFSKLVLIQHILSTQVSDTRPMVLWFSHTTVPRICTLLPNEFCFCSIS